VLIGWRQRTLQFPIWLIRGGHGIRWWYDGMMTCIPGGGSGGGRRKGEDDTVDTATKSSRISMAAE